MAVAGLVAVAALAVPAGRVAASPAPSPSPAFGPPGWQEDDLGAALRAFLLTCRPAYAASLCGAGRRAAAAGGEGPRRFFEAWFEPDPSPARGFLTGYFEPQFDGALVPDGRHRVPLLRPPANLVALGQRPAPPGWPPGLTAALRVPGGYGALPDRAAIEAGALAGAAAPLVYLADPVDAFTIHVQGSARIRFPDGGTVRVGFAGRNGHPYTAIARLLAERDGLDPRGLTADRLWARLKADPVAGREVMAANRSFIFFRRMPDGTAGSGPVGAAGVPLTSGRSLAVDPGRTRTGTPVWLEAEIARPDGGRTRLRRLVVAQDAGAAIVGAGRGDLFVGSGPEAGREAALLRDPVSWTELRPRSRAPAPSR